MGVLAGLPLEGPAARQRDLIAQQPAPRGAGLVLAGEVIAFGVAAAVGLLSGARRPLRDRAGPEGDGVKFT